MPKKRSTRAKNIRLVSGRVRALNDTHDTLISLALQYENIKPEFSANLIPIAEMCKLAGQTLQELSKEL